VIVKLRTRPGLPCRRPRGDHPAKGDAGQVVRLYEPDPVEHDVHDVVEHADDIIDEVVKAERAVDDARLGRLAGSRRLSPE
jgi:hypothetical protein